MFKQYDYQGQPFQNIILSSSENGDSLTKFKSLYSNFYDRLLFHATKRIENPRKVLLEDIDSEIASIKRHLLLELDSIKRSVDFIGSPTSILYSTPRELYHIKESNTTIGDLVDKIQTKTEKRWTLARCKSKPLSLHTAKERATFLIDNFLEAVLGSINNPENLLELYNKDFNSPGITKAERKYFVGILNAFRTDGNKNSFWYLDGVGINNLDYDIKALLEPIYQVIKSPEGDRYIGKVTLNSYGCLVINAANVMFVDVDLPLSDSNEYVEYKQSHVHASVGIEDEALSLLEDFTDKNSHLCFLAYRTYGGLRLVEITQLHDPESIETEQIMTKLAADKYYIRLCKSQKTFRARLTPKPWRLAMVDYGAKVCNIAGKGFYGNIDAPIHPDVQVVLDLHQKCVTTDVEMELA